MAADPRSKRQPFAQEDVPRGEPIPNAQRLERARQQVLQASYDFADCAPHDKTGIVTMRYRWEEAARAYHGLLKANR